MSTDRRAAPPPRLVLMVFLPFLCCLLWSLAAVPTAHADLSPASAIATELRQRPVYVDPSLRSLLDENAQEALEERITATGEPLYVLVVPLARGDTWNGEAAQFVGAVRDRMGGSGSYIALENSDLWLYGEESGSGSNTFYAALAVNSDPELRNASLKQRLERAVELVGSGAAQEEYSRIDAERGPLSPASPLGGNRLVLVGSALAAVGLVLAVVFLGVRARRSRTPLRAPAHSVFDSIDSAGQDMLRKRLQNRLSETGERLAAFPLADASATTGNTVQRALDAHLAAGKALDAATDLAGIAGALVLLDLADDAVARASSSRSTDRPLRHCFFDPLHGTRTAKASWRGLGSRRTAAVWACGQCAEALRQRREPEVLPVVLDGGRRVAYYEIPHRDSVWSATGYGTLRDDLVHRVLRGDLDAAR